MPDLFWENLLIRDDCDTTLFFEKSKALFSAISIFNPFIYLSVNSGTPCSSYFTVVNEVLVEVARLGTGAPSCLADSITVFSTALPISFKKMVL